MSSTPRHDLPPPGDPEWEVFVRLHRRLHESWPELAEQEEAVFLEALACREPRDEAERVSNLEKSLAAIGPASREAG